jgi:hypothetical protein
MNAVPAALEGPGGTVSSLPKTTGTTGTTLVEATEQATSQGNRKQLVDLAGSFIGSIIRSMLGS